MEISINKRKRIICMTLTSLLLSTGFVSGLGYDATIIAPKTIVEASNIVEEPVKLKQAKVNASVLNVRVGPSTNYNIVTQINNGNIVTIINEDNVWREITLSNGIKGWVHSDYIETGYNLPVEETTNVSRSGYGRNPFDNIESITGKYLGKRYSYGAAGPNSFDCSGFSSYILKTYYGDYLKSKGINQVPRRASQQALIGTNVNRNELEKGDLVFFNTNGNKANNINHVGVYIGNGQMVHASTPKAQIQTVSLSQNYYTTRFVKAIRL